MSDTTTGAEGKDIQEFVEELTTDRGVTLQHEDRRKEQVAKQQQRWKRRGMKRERAVRLGILRTVGPEGLCVMTAGEWECIELAVESGRRRLSSWKICSCLLYTSDAADE